MEVEADRTTKVTAQEEDLFGADQQQVDILRVETLHTIINHMQPMALVAKEDTFTVFEEPTVEMELLL